MQPSRPRSYFLFELVINRGEVNTQKPPALDFCFIRSWLLRFITMTTASLFLIFLSVTDVCLSSSVKTEHQSGESVNISGFLPRLKPDLDLSIEYGDIAVSKGSLKNADPCTAKGCKWPKSGAHVNVPYFISPVYTQAETNVILRGFKRFHRKTCIRFIPASSIHRDYIHFDSQDGCWSLLGRQAGGQYISLQKGGCLSIHTVQHELLHALGFHHEQSRSDRDSYVQIETQNIQPEHLGNFNKARTNNLGTPYDFTSVMHYTKYAFTKNGEPTIIAKADYQYDWGRASRMSANDITRVNKLYKCKSTS